MNELLLVYSFPHSPHVNFSKIFDISGASSFKNVFGGISDSSETSPGDCSPMTEARREIRASFSVSASCVKFTGAKFDSDSCKTFSVLLLASDSRFLLRINSLSQLAGFLL